MDGPESEGLGLSVLVYMGALVGVFSVLAVPVYYAASPTVFANPQLARSNPLLNGPIIGVRSTGPSSLAMLQPQIVADAETAAFKAKSKKASAATMAPSRSARRDTGTPMAELQPVRSRPAMFPFSLF